MITDKIKKKIKKAYDEVLTDEQLKTLKEKYTTEVDGVKEFRASWAFFREVHNIPSPSKTELSEYSKDQNETRKLEKLNDTIIPAYKFRMTNGKEMTVSCPKRLLSLTIDEGRDKYKENFIYLNN